MVVVVPDVGLKETAFRAYHEVPLGIAQVQFVPVVPTLAATACPTWIVNPPLMGGGLYVTDGGVRTVTVAWRFPIAQSAVMVAVPGAYPYTVILLEPPAAASIISTIPLFELDHLQINIELIDMFKDCATLIVALVGLM